MSARGESTARRNRASGRTELAPVRRVSNERAYLYQIIQTIGSGPDLETILRGIVRLVTEATACHACFVYFVHDRVLELRAASSIYAHLEGDVIIPIGEGLTGWVAKTRRSAFIRENALEDPRVRTAYFPELEDERFQSLVSVPIFSRAGEVIGVITLHAEAPHEFARADLDFLEHTASLIAGAVENGQLYEDATAKVALLTDLSKLSQRIASAASIHELLPLVAGGCRELLGADRCEIYLLDPDERLSLRSASPERAAGASLDTRRLWLEVLDVDLAHKGGEEARRLAEILWGDETEGFPVVAPLVVGEERLGILAALTQAPVADAESALAAVASHAAVAIKQHQLIDWLKEKNLVKDFFEALSGGHAIPEELAGQAARLGCDLDAQHLVMHMLPWTLRVPEGPRRGRRPRRDRQTQEPSWRELAARVESRVAGSLPGAVFDNRERSTRALLLLGSAQPGEIADTVRRIEREVAAEQAGSASIGLSNPCQEPASFRQGFQEAASAAEVGGLIRGAPGVSTYEDLGPYKYVLLSDEGVRDRYQQRLDRLVAYDRRKGTQLLETLEGYLDRRGNIVGTSRALYIHPNTLRQRLARVEGVAGFELEHEDWLSLAIAIKIVKLRMMRRSAAEERREDG
ncbi:MAG: GAF domain-containing protein [Actinomycetota bacterium]